MEGSEGNQEHRSTGGCGGLRGRKSEVFFVG